MTVYARQIATALRLIKAKGMLCTWNKTVDSKDPNVLPEFAGQTTPKAYKNTPILLNYQASLRHQTIMFDVVSQQPQLNLFGLVPGSVPFAPAEEDTVTLGGQNYTVDVVNILEPDGVPILFEITFR